VAGRPEIKKQTKTKKHVEPNVGAGIFILSNIAPERWQNTQRNDVAIKTEKEEDAMSRDAVLEELNRLEELQKM